MRLASHTAACLRRHPCGAARLSAAKQMASRPSVAAAAAPPRRPRPTPDTRPVDDLAVHADKAWAWWESIGAPKLHVAPMVDQSELAFRMLCRRHGATAAYTPMLHARLFDEAGAYREEHFTTCPADRPLLAQFCGHDPATVLSAALRLAGSVDAVDLNLGCPQRIARKGRYGAFLMDDPATVTAIIAALARGLPVPVTAKMRVFPDVGRTVAFARALEGAGASLVAVHGRTRDQKEAAAYAADWAQIKAVKAALRVPVLANGGVLTLADAEACMAATGADGVLSAIPLLENPALFSSARSPEAAADPAAGALLALEYAGLVSLHPTPPRMVRGHAHRLMGSWLAEFTDLRDALGAGGLDGPALEKVAAECVARVRATIAAGRTTPIPALSARALARLAKEEAIAGAVAEAAREEAALAAIGVVGEEALVERSAACV